MFIQCEHCQAKFQIDENKLPAQKAVVRCSQCSNPIQLPNQKSKKPYILVTCPSCSAQYGVPPEMFKGEMIKAHCNKCEFVFLADRHGQSQEIPNLGAPPKATPPKKAAPAPKDDFSLDGDDFQDFDIEEPTPPKAATKPAAKSARKPASPADEEYMESVSLGEDEEFLSSGLDEDIDTNGVFLDPASSKLKKQAQTWPDIEEEDQALPDDFSLDSLTQDTEDPTESTSKKKTRILPWLILLLLLGGAVYLYFFGEKLFQSAPRSIETVPLRSINEGKTRRSSSEANKLTLVDRLSGKLIYNESLKREVFVMKGTIKSLYPPDDIIRKVKIQGYLHGKEGEKINAETFAGIMLTNKDIENMSEAKLKAHFADPELVLQTAFSEGLSRTLEFQIIFFNPPAQIEKLGAQILSYQFNGKLQEVK